MSHLDAVEIPDKTYFKIGEVAKLLDLEPYVLRYWESEFDVLDPDKTDSGQRTYQRDDIELIFQIRNLLYNEMFTIAGARRQLELEREGKPCYFNSEAAEEGASSEDREQIEQVEQLEAENGELREQIETLAARLEDKDDQQTDMWEARLESQRDEIEALERELAAARETIAQLEANANSDAPGTSVDPQLLQGLRQQIEGLARLGQRPV